MEAIDNTNIPTITEKVSRLIRSHALKHKRGSKTYVYNIPIAFDTETSNITLKDGVVVDPDTVKDNETVVRVGCCYIWMFRFGDPEQPDSIAVYGRDLDTLSNFLQALSDNLKLKSDEKKPRFIYIYAHNLGFDFEHIRDCLQIADVMAESPHKPIYVRDSRGFEFRDSLILTGGLSLEKVGKGLENGLVKLCGNLDYSKIRTPETPMTDAEMGYCKADVDVLASYIQSQMTYYRGLQSVPLTNTGRVRKFSKEWIYASGSFGKFQRYRELMDTCILTPEEYMMCQRAFYGGFTHANIRYVGIAVPDVKSFDFTSSYPAVMISEKFPMGLPVRHDVLSFDEFKAIVNDPDRCCIASIQLSNVHVKHNVGDCYLTNDASKTHIENAIVENGRIRSCDRFEMSCTDVDFRIINQVYDFDSIYISDVLVWNTDYLPTPMIEIIREMYSNKTTLKGVEGMEQEYTVSKGMLNSLYGMCVTRIVRPKIEIVDGVWTETPLTEEEMSKNIQKNNDSKTRFLYYPWGVFITAYARFNLWTAIRTLGDDYIYSDTDSIKVVSGSERLEAYLEDYHHDLNLKISWMCEKRRKFKPSDFAPKTVKGIEKPLGVWDYEGQFQWFKTLGSKRYVKWDGENLYPTVAGISPKNLGKFLMKESKGDVKTALRMFRDGLHVPKEDARKLASFYYEDFEMDIQDYTGHVSHVKQPHGVHLANVNFTLTMTGSFLDVVKLIQTQDVKT